MKINLPYRLASLKTVSAAQLKAMYDAVAAVVNGNLSRDNFARRAGIALAHKAAPRSWLVLEQALPGPTQGNGSLTSYVYDASARGGPSSIRWLIPSLVPSDRDETITVSSWSVVLGIPQIIQNIPVTDPNPVFNYTAGNVRLRHLPAGGAWAVKDTYAVANPSRDQRSGLRALAEFVVAPGDMLEVLFSDFTYSGGHAAGNDLISGASAAVWLKMNHLP